MQDLNVILSGCKKNDRASQKALYGMYAYKIMGICLRYTNSKESAEDILQEVFIRVFEKLDTFRYEGSFEGWMRKIAIATAIEHYRKDVRMSNKISFDEVIIQDESYLQIMDYLSTKELLSSINLLT